MGAIDMIKWITPSGQAAETNGTKAAVSAAKRLKWKRVKDDIPVLEKQIKR